MRGGGGKTTHQLLRSLLSSANCRVTPRKSLQSSFYLGGRGHWSHWRRRRRGLSCLRLIVSPFIKVKRVFNAIVSLLQAFYQTSAAFKHRKGLKSGNEFRVPPDQSVLTLTHQTKTFISAPPLAPTRLLFLLCHQNNTEVSNHMCLLVLLSATQISSPVSLQLTRGFSFFRQLFVTSNPTQLSLCKCLHSPGAKRAVSDHQRFCTCSFRGKSGK